MIDRYTELYLLGYVLNDAFEAGSLLENSTLSIKG